MHVFIVYWLIFDVFIVYLHVFIVYWLIFDVFIVYLHVFIVYWLIFDVFIVYLHVFIVYWLIFDVFIVYWLIFDVFIVYLLTHRSHLPVLPKARQESASKAVIDKSVAAQYYLTRARYSPLTSGKPLHSKPAFNSSAPRFPESNERTFARSNYRQPSSQLPSATNLLPSKLKPVSGYTKNFGMSGVYGAGGQADSSSLKPSSYYSNLTSSKRPAIHGRTDWSSK